MSPRGRRMYVRGVIHNWCNRRLLRRLTLERVRRILAYLEAYESNWKPK